MKKIFGLGFAAVLLTLGLAGCGRPSLSVNHHQLQPDGLGAVIKGQSRHQTIDYRIDNGKKRTEKTHNGSFALTIPSKATNQKVVLSADDTHQTVKIEKADPLITYSSLQSTYNQAITATALSKADQKKAMVLQKQGAKLKQQQQAIEKAVAAAKKKLASGDASAAGDLKTQAANLQATSTEVTKAMKKAKNRVKDQLLPTQSPNGIHNLIETKDVTIRTNTDQNQVVGIALMVPVSAMKNKTDAKKFAISFSVLANSTGADAKKLMKDFKKQTKSSKTSKTTNKALRSNGVDFRIGYSTTTLYIYITKQ
ncbi:hypothetical protein G8J22_00493 [Lentilactobacillus hilgardii]|uniref:hypothetical protein n=1 Tax=Lentilactobacillus hilgardii TaxID=1588 RepID=UPI00019C544E|nr:hypothetical protein [Lentilactobacillus hilgardii]EEI20461.1 hypothetical protein HMPREF0497_0777 [Lentilactobacillus buchneri ATCC 11577]MCT3395355.1 hypothetical protein [Lentilactobacillus hilgardii]QIR08559.1 hypothetical protein G8J22_00493 [Lentilactobacillus hilgardii]